MFGKCLRLLATLGAIALVLSCGGRKAPSLSSDWTTGVPARHSPAPLLSPTTNNEQPTTTLSEALADLDALPTPEGVDEAVFSALKSALREALQNTWTTGVPPVGTGETPVVQGEEKKLVSKPPTGEANRVDDLEITDLHDGTYTLTWSYRNTGDYNQDGIVNVMDITPLAVHFNESADETNEWIDGNGDSVINIADITPLAANFFTDCAGYSVQAADAADGTFNGIALESLNDASGEGRLILSFDLPPGAPRFVRVVPLDGEEVEGTASDVLHVLDPPPPNAIWMVPSRTTIEQGQTLTITVYANELANPLRLLDTVWIDIDSDILSYVEDSWNAGTRGGEWSEKDGIWSLFTSEGLLCAGSVSGGVWPVSPSNEIPPGSSGALYNFQLEAAAGGTANLSFARTDGRYDYTFYTDIAGNKYYFEDSQQLVITVLSGHEASSVNTESMTSEALEAKTASASKQASGPPVGPENAVYDLEITDNGDGTCTLSWSYTNVGDYNQDGIVNPADAARVALHYQEPANESNDWIDGNGDSIVGIIDYLVMVNNAYAECVGYSVQFSESEFGGYAEVMSVPLDRTWELNARKRFNVQLSSPDPGFYRVVPFDGSGSMGEPSVAVSCGS